MNRTKVERQRSGEDRVTAQEIDLDLHGVTEPAEDIDVVPTLFVVTAGRVVVDADLVVNIFVEVGVKLGLKDVLQHAELRDFLGLEGLGSSRTSPSRLPRMLVEYQPATPNMRVLKAGARTVLMKV